ncbi:hypothetical protein LUZ60_013199 [Juncus effusus]|nr:hypothetical protein LUZ60_013199 [Juncus effusus]
MSFLPPIYALAASSPFSNMSQNSNPAKDSWDILSKALGKIVEELIGRGFSILESEVSRYKSIEEELSRLRSTTDRIDSLLKDAERRHIQDDSVKDWLCKLKSVSFDFDDLLDSYQTALNVYNHNKNLSSSNGEGPSRKRKWSSLEIPFKLISVPEWGPLQRRRFGLEIEKIKKRLDDIAKERKDLSMRDSDGSRREMPRESTRVSRPGASHDRNQIVGRKTEVNKIAEILTADSGVVGSNTVPVVAIHGVAGIGKTTLARLVFEDDRVKANFHLRLWVSLTDSCDVTNITKEILEKMTNQSCNDDSLDRLQSRLREHLNSLNERNKFLLVIDNVWAEGFRFWEDLRVPLISGGEGIKVLITTRNEGVYSMMSPLLHLTKLTGLEKQECRDLLQSLAFRNGVQGQPGELVNICKEIADKCHGSPLVVKTLGAFLRGQSDHEEWRYILYEMGTLKKDQNNTLASLLTSYNHLPYHIKQCFAYCSIFPNGYLFQKNQVIRYWMAEGLIVPDGRRRLELVGKNYFDKLIGKSFFEKVNVNGREGFRIPNMMHGMARIISGYEFVDLDYNDHPAHKIEPGRFRYASLLHRDGQSFKFENAFNFGNLRTLILCSELRAPLEKVPPELFPNLTHLRVLDFSNSKLMDLPIIAKDQLIHLRYLGVSNTSIKKLPDSVCQLYNLQTIELGGCTELIELPERISKLVNLHHLDFHINWDKITNKNSFPMPYGISKLTSLQTLSRFNVTLKSSGSCNISELKDLNGIRGELCISNLENVIDEQDAKDANLVGKEFIDKLMLRWSDDCMKKPKKLAKSRDIAESLRPNGKLKCLWIVNYPDPVLPRWLGEPTFTSLETVRISNLFFVPSLRRLPRLKHLYIEKMSVRIMYTFAGFPTLETLMITNMAELEKLFQKQDIPSLHKLEVSNCPNLKEMVIHQNLCRDKIKIWKCPNMQFQNCVCVPHDYTEEEEDL